MSSSGLGTFADEGVTLSVGAIVRVLMLVEGVAFARPGRHTECPLGTQPEIIRAIFRVSLMPSWWHPKLPALAVVLTVPDEYNEEAFTLSLPYKHVYLGHRSPRGHAGLQHRTIFYTVRVKISRFRRDKARSVRVDPRVLAE